MAILFDDLPTEIIHDIIAYVLDASPHTARAVSNTNKCLSEAVKVVHSRRKKIVFDQDGGICRPLQFDSSAYDNTHHLCIEASNNSRLTSPDPTIFTEILGRIKNLKTFTWNIGPVPVEIISALQEFQPACKLQIFRWWRYDESLNHLDQSEVALLKFSNLTHLRYVGGQDGFDSPLAGPYTWQVFREVIAASRRLELASFLVTHVMTHDDDNDDDDGDDDDSDDEGDDSGAKVWIGRVLGPTKDTKEPTKKHITKIVPLRSLTIDSPSFMISSKSLLEIGKFTDLSALEYVKISRGRTQLDYFHTAATLLPNLKHISLNFNGFNSAIKTAAKDYLLTCCPARTLSLWAWSSVITVPELIAHHGKALEVLQLHEKEDLFFDNLPRAALTSTDIKLIEDTCPHLVDLTLDLNVDISRHASMHILEMDRDVVEALKSLVEMRSRMRRIQVYHASYELKQSLKTIAHEDIPSAGNHSDDRVELDEAPPMPRSRNRRDVRKAGRHNLNNQQKKRILPIVEPYATELWKSLYGRSVTGERLLDVKFGEWEQRSYDICSEGEARTFCEVKPHERDDCQGQCVVKTRLWSRHDPKGF